MAIKLSDCFIGNFTQTQGFGANPEYYKQFGLGGHEGLDFGLPLGTPVIASTDGIVIRDLDDPVEGKNYGIYCTVWDKVQSCATYYCHLSSNVVTVGQSVVKGQLLGYSGNTGNTTGPHLHFNLCKTDADGNRINTDNGFLGFVNPLDGRIVEWDIKNPTAPVQPPPIMNPVDSGQQNAFNALLDAFRSLPGGDPLRVGNLEGYVRQVTSEHLRFEETKRKAEQLDGFLSKWLDAWHPIILPEGPLHSVEVEMGKLLQLEQNFLDLRALIEETIGKSFDTDESLIMGLRAHNKEFEDTKKSNKILADKLAKLTEKPVEKQAGFWTTLGEFIKSIFRKENK